MKTLLLFTLIAFFCSCSAAAQIGPKVYDKSKPDSTKTEQKAEKPKKPESKPEKPTAKAADATPKAKPDPGKKQPTSPNLKRALFTTAVENREPVDKVDSLTTDVDQVFLFTEVVGMEGKAVIHRWKYKGEMQAEVHVAVGGPRWRFYSSKKFLPSWTGEWIVEIADGNGNLLGTRRLVYLTGHQAE